MKNQEIPKGLQEAIAGVMHPAINFPLIELGIIRDYYLDGNNVVVTFAFPFPNIPIADLLVNSVENPVNSLGYSMEYQVDLMTMDERGKFLNLETKGWKGL